MSLLLRISELLEPFSSDPGVYMVALHRIDGVPIYVNAKRDKKVRLTTLLYWLEGQIKEVLYYIFTRNLSEASFKFEDMVVRMYPVSKTLVLSIIAKDETPLYKLDLDLESASRAISNLVVV
jgi:predicted regulator of Ras-like GTPase activity (Roadblock/LC7/MglB family)